MNTSTLTPAVNPIGPYANYCDGYGQPGALGLGYISTMKVSTGIVDTSSLANDFVLEDIVAYDRAEKNTSYIGQINMGTASSFCGILGLLWGYDLAVAPDLRSKQLMTMTQYDGTPLPVYDCAALLNAAQELFGSEAERRFPPMPGAYVVCANKSQTSKQGVQTDGSVVNAVWCFIAITIAQDHTIAADLFIEDAGNSEIDNQGDLDTWLDNHRKAVVESIVLCGQDQGATYKETFISYASTIVPPNYVGTALTCAPYIVLAQNAVVGSIEYMRGITLPDWSKSAGAGIGG